MLLAYEVVATTSWGRKLADSTYAVQVVRTPGEAVDAVLRILDRSQSIDDLLAELQV
ncbi:hypothetical protein [Kribbella deserti]|uniref:Uncharacterized protein n=1 Tax=Kribbella deserti TaxID=1926257 RepID=A0ABV6QWY7_9ACTN